jgi:hypothetical protein
MRDGATAAGCMELRPREPFGHGTTGSAEWRTAR